jgi:plastocyanin
MVSPAVRLRARFGVLLAALCGFAACVHGKWPLLPSTPSSASLSGSIAIEGEADASVADAIVFLEPIPQVPAPEPSGDVEILIRRGRFDPRLLVVQRGQRVSWANLDSIFHGVFSYSSRNRFDLGVYAPSERRAASLAASGPVRFHCPLHVGEGGIVFVAPSPYFARSRRAQYAISAVPPGRYWLSAWTDGWSATAREVTLRAGESAHADVVLRRERE